MVNHDDSDEGGSHWVALFAKNSNELYYFDSYGDEPPITIKEHKEKLQENDKE